MRAADITFVRGVCDKKSNMVFNNIHVFNQYWRLWLAHLNDKPIYIIIARLKPLSMKLKYHCLKTYLIPVLITPKITRFKFVGDTADVQLINECCIRICICCVLTYVVRQRVRLRSGLRIAKITQFFDYPYLCFESLKFVCRLRFSGRNNDKSATLT